MSLEQIIKFLNNFSYCTYVGIQYWKKLCICNLIVHTWEFSTRKNHAYVKKGTTGGIEIWGRQQKNIHKISRKNLK
jgi:hypothetical protein